MAKSKSTTDILTQTETSYRQYVEICVIDKTVESFEKHYIYVLLLLSFCFTRIL